MTTFHPSKQQRAGDAAASSASLFTSLADDELVLVLSHLGNQRDLAAVACTSRKMLVLSAHERDRLRQERAKAAAVEKAKRRAARERFASLEGDARLLGTVIRHILLNAPKGYSIVNKAGRKKLAAPPGGVCRLRVGIADNGETVTTDEAQAQWCVDVLAMQESALRNVLFEGEPLGAAGAAVALKQAKLLRLDVPDNTTLHGKVFKLFVRADYLRNLLANSPSLAALVAPPSAPPPGQAC